MNRLGPITRRRLVNLDLSVTQLRTLSLAFLFVQLLVAGCGSDVQRSGAQDDGVRAGSAPSGVVKPTALAPARKRATALNCTGRWEGSEETHKITAWPYRDCFRTDPVVNRRIRLTRNAGAEVVWEQGAGWNGQNALRVRPPDGSMGRHQGYAGLGEQHFHAVRTKRLNIRYLFRYNGNLARYAQRNKWEIAIKYDYSNPARPERITSCGRGIVEGRADPSNWQRKDMSMSQGVCTSKENVRNKSGWFYGPKVRENEWICIENEFDLETGWYRTYITTQDGVYNESLHTEINIGSGDYGAPAEKVPSPYWWGSVDCSAGCFWGWPDDMGIVPRPEDTYIWYSHFVMSNQRIGPPAGFVKGKPSRND